MMLCPTRRSRALPEPPTDMANVTERGISDASPGPPPPPSWRRTIAPLHRCRDHLPNPDVVDPVIRGVQSHQEGERDLEASGLAWSPSVSTAAADTRLPVCTAQPADDAFLGLSTHPHPLLTGSRAGQKYISSSPARAPAPAPALHPTRTSVHVQQPPWVTQPHTSEQPGLFPTQTIQVAKSHHHFDKSTEPKRQTGVPDSDPHPEPLHRHRQWTIRIRPSGISNVIHRKDIRPPLNRACIIHHRKLRRSRSQVLMCRYIRRRPRISNSHMDRLSMLRVQPRAVEVVVLCRLRIPFRRRKIHSKPKSDSGIQQLPRAFGPRRSNERPLWSASQERKERRWQSLREE